MEMFKNDGGNEEEDLKSLAMMKSPISKGGDSGFIGVEVSGPFHNDLHGEQVYFIVMRTKKIGNMDSPFYVGADVMARIVEMFKGRLALFKGWNFDWVSNLHDLPLVGGNWNQYKKTQKGSAIRALAFFVNYKRTVTSKEARDAIENIFNGVLAQLLSKNERASSAGKWVMAILEQNKPELYEWLVKAKGKTNAKVATDVITKEINGYFGMPFEFKYNVKLEKTMAEYDIVQFLNQCLHMENWEGVSEYNMRHIFGNYPNITQKLRSFTDVTRPSLYGSSD
jgi:hypothetical protein